MKTMLMRISPEARRKAADLEEYPPIDEASLREDLPDPVVPPVAAQQPSPWAAERSTLSAADELVLTRLCAIDRRIEIIELRLARPVENRALFCLRIAVEILTLVLGCIVAAGFAGVGLETPYLWTAATCWTVIAFLDAGTYASTWSADGMFVVRIALAIFATQSIVSARSDPHAALAAAIAGTCLACVVFIQGVVMKGIKLASA
jgi:hypothetical protein